MFGYFNGMHKKTPLHTSRIYEMDLFLYFYFQGSFQHKLLCQLNKC